MKKALLFSAAALVVLLLTAPPLATAAEPLFGELVIEGTGDSQELLRAVARRFEKTYPNTIVAIPEPVGSSGGIKALMGNRAELARLNRELTGHESTKGISYRPFARCPVAFAVHQEVKGVDQLTAEQVSGIYSGDIVRWDELGGGGLKIYPVMLEKDESSTLALAESVPGLERAACPMCRTAYTSPEAVEIIKGHKNTIGYAPLPEFKDSGLRVMNFGGYVPSPESLANGRYKPSVTLGIAFRGGLQPVSREFLRYLKGRQAQRIIRSYGCLPVVD